VKVAFLSPAYPPEQRGFTRGLATVGATVIGVGDGPEGGVDPETRRHLSGWLQVPHLFDEERATATLVEQLGRIGVDRVITNWEPLVLLAAGVNDALGLGGMSRDVALGFRDKQVMKERLAAAGIRVPRSRRVATAEEAWAAADEVGYPLILKPIAGAGSADTFRCDDAAALEAALAKTQHVREASVEEFIDGEEFTYDTVCTAGTVRFDSVAQYFPRPLVFRSEQWISPAQIVLRDPHVVKDLQGGIAMGKRVLEVLGMTSGFTHMEWYRKADGEAVFGEVACRNGGGHFVDMHNLANDVDLFIEWARAVCWEAFEATPKRLYHVGMVFKRAQGQGRITGIEGLARLRAVCGPWLVGESLLPVGSPRRDWTKTLLSDGFVTMRHPELSALRQMMRVAVGDLQMYAG
jgi:hypothetical protein